MTLCGNKMLEVKNSPFPLFFYLECLKTAESQTKSYKIICINKGKLNQ